MQQSPVFFTAALWLLGASNVFAESSVDMSVVGKITPVACTPALSNGGVVDLGKISAQDLLTGWPGETPLPDATLALSVNCISTALVAIKVTDNRPGTVYGGTGSYPNISEFGLGLASNGKPIGRYRLTTINASADAVASEVIEKAPGALTWISTSSTAGWQPNWLRSVSNGSAGSDLAPRPLQTFKTDLIVSTRIAPKSTLPIAEEIQIDGSATLDIVYL